MTSAGLPLAPAAEPAVPGVDPAVGDEIGPLTVHVDRAQLVRYAGASGDFNPIHWNPRVATSVGLDDVIAHGMLTMALAGRLVTDWIGDPAAITDFEVRFTRPVVVPDPDGVDVEITGRVAEVAPGGSADGPGNAGTATARVDLTVTVDGRKVLGKARATVRLPGSARST
ncbi:MAG: MaoC family dehydratase [Actinobacteria bacterium]|jgi:acyl dehydratase|nr:MaoC family dehydratase [Actinomycetota bacterium]